MTYYVCNECDHATDEPIEQTEREYDGFKHGPFRTTLTRTCPDCGSDNLDEREGHVDDHNADAESTEALEAEDDA